MRSIITNAHNRNPLLDLSDPPDLTEMLIVNTRLYHTIVKNPIHQVKLELFFILCDKGSNGLELISVFLKLVLFF